MSWENIMAGEPLDTLDLAAAIWLAHCPPEVRLPHKVLRRLTDHLHHGFELLAITVHQACEWLSSDQADQPDQLDQVDQPNPPEEANPWLAWLKSRQGWSDALDQARKVKSLDIIALTTGHPLYPVRLRQINDAPAILYVRGQRFREAQQQPCWITVIGTRNPTLYGQLVTEQITTDLARQGAVIVSGLARGIDTIAHETALEQQALTLAVVASGVDIIYPAANQRLSERIREQGAIVSEHPPGTPPLRQYFPARNRILSGLSDAVAVMEAAQKSGTLITSTFAADQGREVLAVPGNILDRASCGCHQLIRDGASLLESSADIFAVLPKSSRPIRSVAYAPDPQDSTRQLSLDLACSPDPLPIDPLGGHILRCLRQQTLHPAQLASHLKVPVHQVTSQLAALELQLLISEQRGRYALTALGQSSI